MSNYQALEEKLATDLIDAYGSRVADTGMMPELQALIDALPFFGNPAWNSAFRSALANLAAANLPNNAVSPEPDTSRVVYWYNGPYSGYRDAFFTGLVQSAAASNAAAQMQAVNAGLTGAWWGQYAVALLTDAVRSKVHLSLDTAALTARLASGNSTILPPLSAAFLAVIGYGFAATASAYAVITSAGKQAMALQQLTASVTSSKFIANSNQAMSMGGDSTTAATWFLYNNWILLKLLGGNADAVISQAIAAGLNVPSEVGAGSWWNGGYTQWFTGLSGADVIGLTGTRIIDALPEKYIFSGPILHKQVPFGYSLSLTDWGPLAQFKPPPVSCLGAGTGILMADLSSKPIETVAAGDMVWSMDGPHEVALVESPLRAGRTLTRIAGLDLFLTQGHPVRRVSDDGPRYAAVGAWILRDTTPTMTEAGVVELAPGVTLLAVSDGRIHDHTVEALTGHAETDDEARVYDLLLKNWETKKPAYFAGGPDTFVGVEAESSNPLREPNASTVLLCALDASVAASRTHVSQPHIELPALVNRFDAREHEQRALSIGWAQDGSEELKRPPIPGPNFYQIDGRWEPHASTLEACLLRRYARSWRRLLATGWRCQNEDRGAASHVTLLACDVEIVGEIALRPDEEIALRFMLLDYGFDFNRTAVVSARPSAGRRWHPRFDSVVDLGPAALSEDAALLVTCASGDVEIGRCVVPIGASQRGEAPAEYFMSASDGSITARVAFDLRWTGQHDRRLEAASKSHWSPHRIKAMAMALGSELGGALAARLTQVSRGGG